MLLGSIPWPLARLQWLAALLGSTPRQHRQQWQDCIHWGAHHGNKVVGTKDHGQPLVDLDGVWAGEYSLDLQLDLQALRLLPEAM